MTKDLILQIHTFSIENYGGSLGIRDEGYLQSAIERPYATFAGEDLYPGPFEKAAAILESILKNHPFVDGNKRTGFLACSALLRIYSWEVAAQEPVAYDFVIEVASTQMDFAAIVGCLEKYSQPL